MQAIVEIVVLATDPAGKVVVDDDHAGDAVGVAGVELEPGRGIEADHAVHHHSRGGPVQVHALLASHSVVAGDAVARVHPVRGEVDGSSVRGGSALRGDGDVVVADERQHAIAHIPRARAALHRRELLVEEEVVGDDHAHGGAADHGANEPPGDVAVGDGDIGHDPGRAVAHVGEVHGGAIARQGRHGE